MKTTTFTNKNHGTSSIRVGNPSLKMTQYMSDPAGGVTFKSGNFTARFDKSGQVTGTAIKTGKHTTYYGKNGSVVTKLTPYK